MLRNKIFITSQQNGSSLDFVKNIFKTSKTDFPQKTVDERLKETENTVEGVRIPYELDTKYYKAKVDFWLDELTDPKPEEIQAYTQAEEVTQVIDAFVFCFEKSNPETFRVLEKWTPFLELVEPSIKLCIANSGKGGAQADDAEEWCLSRGFDYVDMDEATDIPMDKVGYELALEILQTHFWDGMVKKKSDGTLEEEDEEDDIVKDLQELKLQQYKDLLELEDEEEDAFDMPTQDEINKMQAELFGDIDGEDGLDKAYDAIQAMREHGKDLSDDERRKMAAKVALSFAAQLGL
ncbi:hypothetical protein K501DRAFT_214925 [Backusella circina FSU 941]|nr:hypothetical protein K501DRAFT_214925 [Backusella circina FSU 941]